MNAWLRYNPAFIPLHEVSDNLTPLEEIDSTNLTEGTLAAATGGTFIRHHAPTEVLGFHGCTKESAESILSSKTFRHSTKAYDWLGDGFYFWEYAPHRAMDWAEALCADGDGGSKPAVIEATIHLGNCLNLLDTEHMQNLAETYRRVVDIYASQGRPLPKNTPAGAHLLDRQVINLYCRRIEEITGTPFQTVRGCFPEGVPIYSNSKILDKTHLQIAVRDPTCISCVSIIQLV